MRRKKDTETQKASPKTKTKAKRGRGRVVKKEAVEKKPAAKKPTPSLKDKYKGQPPIEENLTKAKLYRFIAQETAAVDAEVNTRQVGAVFDALEKAMYGLFQSGGFRKLSLPGVLSFAVKEEPTEDGGEETVIQVKPMKRLKDMIAD